MPLMLLAAPDLHTGSYLQRLHAADNLPITASSNQTSLNSTANMFPVPESVMAVFWPGPPNKRIAVSSSVLVDKLQLHYLCSHPWVAEGLLGTR